MKILDRALNVNAGIFIARFTLALVFIAHGTQKFILMPQTAGFFSGLGLSPFFAYLTATAEVLSGLGMLLGVWTRLAGALMIIIMIFAIYLVKYSLGFFSGYEYDLVLLLMALSVIFSGPGKYSVARR